MQESDEEGEKKTAQIVDVHFHLEEDNQEDIWSRQLAWLKFCTTKRKSIVFEGPKTNIWTSVQSASYSNSVIADKIGKVSSLMCS